jgi:hypothetical protein
MVADGTFRRPVYLEMKGPLSEPARVAIAPRRIPAAPQSESKVAPDAIADAATAVVDEDTTP